ncbi:MAG: hypothetical protein K6D59_08960 [Bacteroidales bacterium]|nr:hypothetical protein [Bacteroidales bacterium]
MKSNIDDFMEMAQSARYGIEKESDRLLERLTRMEDYRKLLDGIDELIADNKRQREELESLQQQLAEEKQQRTEMETKMNEMSKLSAGMARKAAQDDFHKALRIYLNISKRKTIGKREAAKNVITDLMTSAKLELPEDIMEMLEHLDDEQSETKVVTVNGNYIEAHDNKEVKFNG